MPQRTVAFELGGGLWVAERKSVSFTGITAEGPVAFLITSEALQEMINPELKEIDSDFALEIFAEFEADIHRIARLEFNKRSRNEPPIILTAADVQIR